MTHFSISPSKLSEYTIYPPIKLNCTRYPFVQIAVNLDGKVSHVQNMWLLEPTH